MRIVVFLGLFLPVILAGASVYVFKINKRVLKLLVAFSGAYLISLVFNELIPQIYSSVTDIGLHENCDTEIQGHMHNSHHYIIGLLILVGFFVQLMLDYLTKGIEHGHIGHNHSHHGAAEKNHSHSENGEGEISLSFIPVLIGLFLHSFLEGMPLANGLSSVDLQNRLLTGIIIHNIPISIILVSLMIQSRISKIKALIFLCIFAFSAPLGAFLTNIIGTGFFGTHDHYFNYIMAVVVGIFLHISTTILFETDENHRFNFIKFVTMILGVFAAILHF